jgi:hypothetical protein
MRARYGINIIFMPINASDKDKLKEISDILALILNELIKIENNTHKGNK